MGPRGLVRVGHKGAEWMDPGSWFGQRVASGVNESDRLHWRGSGFGGKILSSFRVLRLEYLCNVFSRETVG